jgi:uncharacterized protein
MKLTPDELNLVNTVRAVDTAKVVVIVHGRKVRKIHVEINAALAMKVREPTDVPRGTFGQVRTRE